MEELQHDVDIQLSILIPCYNWNVLNLINDLHTLCIKEKRLTHFEIICLEDGSSDCFTNDSMSDFKNVKYEILPKNIGRSAIRNLLAQKARFEWLLFIDCDSKIATKDFIWNYIDNILPESHVFVDNLEKHYGVEGMFQLKQNLYYGETIYEKKETKHKLHQKYGSKIESKRKKDIFSSHHFLVNKTAFIKNQFDEDIKEYGYEDVLFQINCSRGLVTSDENPQIMGRDIFHFHYIKNPLYHMGLKTNQHFIQDCEAGLNNLLKYVENKKIIDHIRILNWWWRFSFIGVRIPIVLIFNIFKSSILKNLHSKNPSLLLFQFYKLGFFFQLEYNSRKQRK